MRKKKIETFLENKVVPKNSTQEDYLDALKESSLIVTYGPAGVGKSYIPTMIATELLITKKINKLVICRPTVPTGRSIGFFPGTIEEKMNPWAAPILSIIKSSIGKESYSSWVKGEDRKIEIVPFEVIRGRTFNDAFVILDEAQNCTYWEIKAFVTRLGHNCKAVLNGDITQSDIPEDSGLGEFISLIEKYDIPNTEIIEFTTEDVVRSELVKNLLIAFDKEEDMRGGKSGRTIGF